MVNSGIPEKIIKMRLRIANKTPQSKAITTLWQNDYWIKEGNKIALNAHFRPQLNFDLSHLHLCHIELEGTIRILNSTEV